MTQETIFTTVDGKKFSGDKAGAQMHEDNVMKTRLAYLETVAPKLNITVRELVADDPSLITAINALSQVDLETA